MNYTKAQRYKVNKYRQIHWCHSADMWRDANVYEIQLLLSSGPQSNSETQKNSVTLDIVHLTHSGCLEVPIGAILRTVFVLQ